MDRPDTRRLWNANAPAWVELTRAGYDVYRDLVNTPAFFAMLPSVAGARCIDLGCGEGHNTRLLAARGAQVIAVDVAEVLLTAARSGGDGPIAFVQADGTVLPFATSSVDAVTAFMSVMDMADPEAALREVARVLRPGGFVQFSVAHPVTSTARRRWVDGAAGGREALAVGDYFVEGPVTERWTFSAAPEDVRSRHGPFTITYARRTLAGWLHAVLDAGLSVDAVAEPHADERTARDHPEVADTRIVPYFLLLRARKP